MTAPEHLANRDLDVAATLPAAELPGRARIVIVGGGIIGASIAYHLAAAGERDVVLVERGRLTNGTTWHAAGLVSQARGTHALTALAAGNAETYERIGAETGVETGLRRYGSMSLARTAARMDELRTAPRRSRATSGSRSRSSSRSGSASCGRAWRVDDLVGGVYFPDDGTVNPGVCRARVREGRRWIAACGTCPRPRSPGSCRGADGRRVTGLETSRGEIEAETVVLAPACGPRSWRGSPARASRSTRPSTSGS